MDARVVGVTRLKRFEDHRFIGDRRTMAVYDCDDPEEFGVLERIASDHDLTLRNLIQTFAPDELDEAFNRSFSRLS